MENKCAAEELIDKIEYAAKFKCILKYSTPFARMKKNKMNETASETEWDLIAFTFVEVLTPRGTFDHTMNRTHLPDAFIMRRRRRQCIEQQPEQQKHIDSLCTVYRE